tara:strand:+ start:364 stop:567 length:204 start_codon:yes stop_codon:yes gene_type:complete
MTWHANVSNYKFLIIDKVTGDRKLYLNAKDLCDEFDVKHSTLYRILTGAPSRKYDKKYLFMRVRIPV